MRKRTLKGLSERVTGFLKAEDGGAEIWIIVIMVLSIIIAFYTADSEIERVKQAKFQINEHLIMALKGATKRIDFYEASEGNIVIESDFLEQLSLYVQEALLLNNQLAPLNTKDFGIEGKITISSIDEVAAGYDARTNRNFTDAGLVAEVIVPMNMRILGLDFPLNLTFKPYAEIRR